MKIDINNAFNLISLAFMLIGGIYQLARIEANINSKIDKVETSVLTEIDNLKDNFVEKFYTTDKKLDVHLTEYEGKKELYEHRLHTAEQKIEHKFNRLRYWIEQIVGFLQKQSDFQIRDDKF